MSRSKAALDDGRFLNAINVLSLLYHHGVLHVKSEMVSVMLRRTIQTTRDWNHTIRCTCFILVPLFDRGIVVLGRTVMHNNSN